MDVPVISQEEAKIIEDSRKHYKCKSNILAHTILAIGIDMHIEDVDKLKVAVYKGYILKPPDRPSNDHPKVTITMADKEVHFR